MATYVNNLRLTELATGEGSGTWGTTTNTNLELIGEALGYGSEAIANASTHTITVADGTADSARSFYLKLTGGGQACTVTLAPNTLSKVWMVENTTNSTLTFTQGSGANVAVPAGQVKMIATDGAGSGAVVYDLLVDTDLTGTTTVVNLTASGTVDAATVEFDSLSGTGAVAVTDILDQDDMSSNSATALATQQSIKAYVDSSVASFDTLAEVLAQGNTTGSNDIDVDAAQKVQFRDSAIYINSSTDGQLDIVADTEIQIAATTIDINGAVDMASTLAVASSITSTSSNIIAGTGTDAIQTMRVGSGSGGANKASINFQNSASSEIFSLDFDNSTGTLDIRSDLTGNIASFGRNGGITFNQDSNDYDFRVESNNNANMLFVDGGNDRITIGGNDGTGSLHVKNKDSSGSDVHVVVQNTTANRIAGYKVQDESGNTGINLLYDNGANTGTLESPIGDLTLDVAGDITLDADGAQVRFKDAGTEFFKVSNESGFVELQSPVADSDIKFNGIDGSSIITALTLDMSAAGAATFNSSVTTGGEVSITPSSGTAKLRLTSQGVGSEVFTVNGQIPGVANGGFAIRNETDSRNDFFIDAAGAVNIPGAFNALGGAIFNEASADVDFRVESDNNANMLFVDGGNDRVYVGGSTNVNTSALQVTGQAAQSAVVTKVVDNNYSLFQGFNASNALITQITGAGALTHNGSATFTTADNNPQLTLISTDADANAGPLLVLDRNSASPADGDVIGSISFNGKNDAAEAHGYAKIESRIVDASNATEDGRLELATSVAGTEGISRILMDATETVVNDNSADVDFRVESDGNANMLFVDGGTDRVHIGTTSGTAGNLVVVSNSSANGIQILARPADDYAFLNFYNYGATAQYGAIAGIPSGMLFYDNAGTERFRIQNSQVVVNDPSNDIDFRVESNAESHAVFVDAGNDRVGLFSSSPTAGYKVSIGGGALNVIDDNAINRITSTAGYTVDTGGNGNIFRLATLSAHGARARARAIGSMGYGDPVVHEFVIEMAIGNATDEFGVNVYRTGDPLNQTRFKQTNAEFDVYTDKVNDASFDVWVKLGHFTRLEFFLEAESGTTARFDNSGTATLPGTAVDTNTKSEYIMFADDVRITTQNTAQNDLKQNVNFNFDGVVFNEDSVDLDFRVESDSNTHMLFVDAGSNEVGIGTSDPRSPLHVQIAHTETNVTTANTNSTLSVGNSGSGNGVYNAIKFPGNQQDMYIMSVNNNTAADRRLGFFVGSVAGDSTGDEHLAIKGKGAIVTSADNAVSRVTFAGSKAGVSDDVATSFVKLIANTSEVHGHLVLKYNLESPGQNIGVGMKTFRVFWNGGTMLLDAISSETYVYNPTITATGSGSEVTLIVTMNVATSTYDFEYSLEYLSHNTNVAVANIEEV